jgi:hypothetical protein
MQWPSEPADGMTEGTEHVELLLVPPSSASGGPNCVPAVVLLAEEDANGAGCGGAARFIVCKPSVIPGSSLNDLS